MLQLRDEELVFEPGGYNRSHTAHIIFGASADDIGLVDRGIVFAVNPVLPSQGRFANALFPVDWLVSADAGYLLGRIAGATDAGVLFRQKINAHRTSVEEVKKAMIGDDKGLSALMYAETRTLVPYYLAEKLNNRVFRTLPRDAFEPCRLGMLQDTSLGCAIAAARYSGINYVVISGLERLKAAKNPKPLLKFTEWLNLESPSWLYSFSPNTLGVPVYVHPDMKYRKKR